MPAQALRESTSSSRKKKPRCAATLHLIALQAPTDGSHHDQQNADHQHRWMSYHPQTDQRNGQSKHEGPETGMRAVRNPRARRTTLGRITGLFGSLRLRLLLPHLHRLTTLTLQLLLHPGAPRIA